MKQKSIKNKIMKNLTISIGMLLLSFNSFAIDTPKESVKNSDNSKEWNTNTDKVRTFKKGDIITIKKASDASQYLQGGTVEHICNKDYIKVNGFFVKVVDVDVIVKYSNVK